MKKYLKMGGYSPYTFFLHCFIGIDYLSIRSIRICSRVLSCPRISSRRSRSKVKSLGLNAHKQVLFVGNSYLYYGDSLHNHVVRLAKAADKENVKLYKYKSATISRSYIWHHNIESYIKPGIVLQKDYDGSHPDLLGTYLAAFFTYAALYEKSPVGNSYNYYTAIDADMAAFLQQIAWETVTSFYGW